MPQMAPLYWLYLFFFFLIMLSLFLVLTFFIKPFDMKSSTLHTNPLQYKHWKL
uniref:ATP synthase F0 subunit 8 n=1 Tax=Xenograpsus testudinatus TaxID=533011 RepID=D0PS52_9EUCA|nr:ATP synthase F0 subunit 8 [Xenograpsus testudinatus]ACF08703.1 ATP synthase F0 subunit 8 [Xenograpsus testudinatus]